MATEKRLRKVRKREKKKKENKIITSRKPLDSLPADKQTELIDKVGVSKENLKFAKEIVMLKEMIQEQYNSIRQFEDYLIDLKTKLTKKVLTFSESKKYADVISDINNIYNAVYRMRTVTFKNLVAKYVRLSKSKDVLKTMEYVLDMENTINEQHSELEAKLQEVQELLDKYEMEYVDTHEEPTVDIKLPELRPISTNNQVEEPTDGNGTTSSSMG